MQARPVGSRREAVWRLQTGCREALGLRSLEKKHWPLSEKEKKMALMRTGLPDTGKNVERGGQGRVSKEVQH